MNSVQLVGRLVRDVDIKYSTGENANAIGRFTVAVNRRFKNKETDQYDADFINCVAFGSTSEFISKWFHKGEMIGLNGRIQTGSYTNKDGIKVYTTDVVVENVEFVGSKNSGADNTTASNTITHSNDTSWMNVPDTATGDENLPW